MSDTIRVDGELPALHIPWPQCDHCGNDVQMDFDDVWCDTCLLRWSGVTEGEPGRPDDGVGGSEVPCEYTSVTDRPVRSPWVGSDGQTYTPGPPLPCILPSGHEGEHLRPYDVEVSS